MTRKLDPDGNVPAALSPFRIFDIVDGRAHARGVTLHFIRPGKPVDNAFFDSFEGKLCSSKEYVTRAYE